MSTNVVSAKDIQRDWVEFDASGKVLGRLAVEISRKLMGKDRPNFVPYLDMGDFVVVTNASQIKVTGNKKEQKEYARHSGYPGGFRSETLVRLLERRPEAVIEHAVKGMLPKTKLAHKMIKRLYVYSDNNHPYKKQFKKQGEQ